MNKVKTSDGNVNFAHWHHIKAEGYTTEDIKYNVIKVDR